VILLFSSMVVDVGVLRNDRQSLVNAMDSTALAGGTLLPVTGATEATAANQLMQATASANFPGLPVSAYTITYRCLIGVDASSPPKPYISRDVPLTCDPTHALGHTPPVAADFVGAGTTRYSICNPTLGDKCNVVVVQGSRTTPFTFSRIVGVDNGSTGVVTSAACNGPCGASPLTPVDVILIMDRSSSMSGVDTTNALTAANSIRTLYTPTAQWLGLSLLGPSVTSGSCLVTPAGSIGTAMAPTDVRRWVPLQFSGTGAPINQDYTLSTSTLANNLKTPCYANSSTGTDLADPLAMAEYYLLNSGRTGVRKGIILETDGQPNTQTASGTYTSTNTCNNTALAATHAKAAGIEIFTIAFGLDGANDPLCPDTSGAWKSKTASAMLTNTATQPSVNGGCPGTSNSDGDHYFCIPKTAGASADLADVFKAAAAALAKGGSRLMQLYPVPVISSVSPTTGTKLGGTSVTITGSFFTGATSVTFSGTAATFTVNSDSSITATSPAGPANTTVDIRVTTPGGTTTNLASDNFTYGP
jgi:hypothetical protein